MKLEDHVTNLELSERLKELGVKQFGTLFAWAEVGKEKDKNGKWIWEYQVVKNDFQADIEFIAAFTASELGEILPNTIKFPKAGDKRSWHDVSHLSKKEIEEMRYVGLLSISKPTDWTVLYQSYIILGSDIKADTHDKTMANAMAKMLIYLIENKLINL
jgi:hypothetical protein